MKAMVLTFSLNYLARAICKGEKETTPHMINNGNGVGRMSTCRNLTQIMETDDDGCNQKFEH